MPVLELAMTFTSKHLPVLWFLSELELTGVSFLVPLTGTCQIAEPEPTGKDH